MDGCTKSQGYDELAALEEPDPNAVQDVRLRHERVLTSCLIHLI